MDSNAGPTSVFVATKLIYVETLKLTSLLSGFVVRLLQHFLVIFRLSDYRHINIFVETIFMPCSFFCVTTEELYVVT